VVDPPAYETTAGQAGLEPSTFWGTRKGGTPAASPSVGVYYAGAGQPIYSRRRAIGWFSSQSVRSTRFRRISFFEPESYTFRAKKIRQSGIALRNPGKKMGW